MEPLDEYVMVEKDDVMEAISEFVATYLMQLPEAQNLKPEELQRALGGAIAVSPGSTRCENSVWGPGPHGMQVISSTSL